MNVSNTRDMNVMCKNSCIIYLTSSSPAGFGALHLILFLSFYYKYYGALHLYLLQIRRSNKATEWRNICSLAS